MKAIILAAGASRRLKPFTDDLPKCLLQIGKKSLLEHQLDAINDAKIAEATIVVGYLKEKIMNLIGKSYKNISKIEYIENNDYESTNTIYSLYLAGEHFRNRDFIYFNADVLMHGDVVRLLANDKHPNVLAVDYVECKEEEVKFVTDSEGRIVKLGKNIPLNEAEGEFIGVAKFGKEITRQFIYVLSSYSKRNEKNLFFEKAVEDILDKNIFYTLDVSKIPNIEIDFPDDLDKARNQIYPAIINYNKLRKSNKIKS